MIIQQGALYVCSWCYPAPSLHSIVHSYVPPPCCSSCHYLLSNPASNVPYQVELYLSAVSHGKCHFGYRHLAVHLPCAGSHKRPHIQRGGWLCLCLMLITACPGKHGVTTYGGLKESFVGGKSVWRGWPLLLCDTCKYDNLLSEVLTFLSLPVSATCFFALRQHSYVWSRY